MLRARFPLLAVAFVALAVGAYMVLAGQSARSTVDEILDLQARDLAQLLRAAAERTEKLRGEVQAWSHRYDEAIRVIVVEQFRTGRPDPASLARLRTLLPRLFLDLALVVDEEGKVLAEVRPPRRPGARGPGFVTGRDEREVIGVARRVASGEPAPARHEGGALGLRITARAYYPLPGRRALALVRSPQNVDRMRVEAGLEDLLRTFRGHPTVDGLQVLDPSGNVVRAEGSTESGDPDLRILQETIRLGDADHTLVVAIRQDKAVQVDARARRTAFLVGALILLLGAGAVALVFHLQRGHLERERELRMRAEQDRRLAALGRLTAGVAHEIKNPLNTIRLSAVRLGRRVGAEEGEQETEMLRAIDDAVSEITRNLDDFRKLVRDPAVSPEPGDAVAVLIEAAAQVRPMAEEAGREILLEPGSSPLRALLDAGRLREALVNLLRNAVHASRHRVRGSVREEGGRVRFDVEDDGPGVPAALREEVFELFYTGKPEGTGLGLPLARRVAEDHGGDLTVDDASLGGARFTLSIPKETS